MNIEELAKLSGVSVATVSRYINKTAPVAKSTAKSIQKAIKETGYKKPVEGRIGRPIGSSSPSVGQQMASFIHIDSSEMAARTQLSQVLFDGVSVYFSQLKVDLYNSLIHVGAKLPSVLTDNRSLGSIVRGNVHELSKNSQEMLSKRPIVKVFNSNLINCPDVSFDCDDVNPDDDAVGVMAARALFNRGYTRMHVLKTSAKNLIIKERVFSFVRTCSEIGVSVSVGPVVDDLDFYSEIRSTIEVLKSEIKQNGDEKIGIFIPVSSDEPIVWNKVLESEHISLGASNDGVSVALCSNVFDFDEAQRSYFCNIDINTHEIGRLAAELLYLKQYRKEDTISIHARVKPRLIPFV